LEKAEKMDDIMDYIENQLNGNVSLTI